MPMLAVCRAFQGIGAGGIFTLTSAVLGDIVPPRERGPGCLITPPGGYVAGPVRHRAGKCPAPEAVI